MSEKFKKAQRRSDKATKNIVSEFKGYWGIHPPNCDETREILKRRQKRSPLDNFFFIGRGSTHLTLLTLLQFLFFLSQTIYILYKVCVFSCIGQELIVFT